MDSLLLKLKERLAGELFTDKLERIIYATDASVYRELPLAVAIPKDKNDLIQLVLFAQENNLSLVPRAAGTSLAGQVVGGGIIVDISKYFTKIIEIDKSEKWVKVQPGVIRDELNMALKEHGLYFGPETSTANRAMIGGMVGNNSCGANSLIYRSVREHALEIEALLSDGTEVVFKALTFEEFCDKCKQNDLEGIIYRHIRTVLSDYDNQVEIRKEFPKKSIPRRNTGYAIDMLLATDPFVAGAELFNFCKIICGSEGTLALITAVKLNLSDLFLKPTALLCIHFDSLEDALQANIIALNYKPRSSELIDHYILECTKNNVEQNRNRFFVKGEPKAILVVELDADNDCGLKDRCLEVEKALRERNLGYHFPIVFGDDKKRVWSLRKAGLGLLSNIVGDAKPVAVVEDTAVDVEDLPAYVRDFNALLSKYGLYSVHYAHAATGELHLRPILNLKKADEQEKFREVALDVARLVKRYQGSLSGEHGDGRLRGEFIRFMVGEKNYRILEDIKKTWDPIGIFNPGKIVNTPSMNTHLRYTRETSRKMFPSVFRYNGQNILQHAEQCNGSGDCRKTHLSGGTMCPSYMATRNERDTTRARANVLREMLTTSDKENPFDYQEIKDVMDLCLSCKACKIECPSGVDMSKLKADFLQAYHDANGVHWRSWLIGNNYKLMLLASNFAGLYNWTVRNKWTGQLLKKALGFAQERNLPTIAAKSLKKWFLSRNKLVDKGKGRVVYFFFDEFTNLQDVEIGKKAVLLLESLGYTVRVAPVEESGRALVSKGFLRKAKSLANRNVKQLSEVFREEVCMVGIEPSAILMFRDEYVDLVDEQLVEEAKYIAKRTRCIEEFLADEMKAGHIKKESFKDERKNVVGHIHCQQKAWGIGTVVADILSFPENFQVQLTDAGCCGMAGAFGMEKEHYKLSQDIAALSLFPAIRRIEASSLVVAAGTSCRQQIKEGTAVNVLHPVEVLYDALR